MTSHLERSTTWAGLHGGDAVEVAGVRGRAATWRFVAHVRNARNGEEWVEVVGGRPGAHTVRSFRLEQIYPASGSGARLADAPRLPL